MNTSMISVCRRMFHTELLDEVLSVNALGVPTNADKDSAMSVRLALLIAQQLNSKSDRERLKGQTSGNKFEIVIEHFLSSTFLNLMHIRPGSWKVLKVGSRARISSIAQFDQYLHLVELAELAKHNPNLAAALGSDYVIAPDIVIYREPESDEFINFSGEIVDKQFAKMTPLRLDNGCSPTLHASISCKWTLRSDRAQNAKSEALNLVRNRKGHLPHIVAVTAEPLPSRIASLALGTGDLDCVYHFALQELVNAVREAGDSTSKELLETMIQGRRLRDISDLPFDLVV